MQSEFVVFYTDFAKAFDRVTFYDILFKQGKLALEIGSLKSFMAISTDENNLSEWTTSN